MKENLWSLTGVSFIIGAAGFLSAITTLFIDTDSSISIKWLLLTLLIFIVATSVLIKTIFDKNQLITSYSEDSTQYLNHAKPLRYVVDQGVFVIKKNDIFVSSILVGCYIEKEGIERLAFLGATHIVQEKIIQIKILKDMSVLEKIPSSYEDLQRIIIRPSVPLSVLETTHSE